MLQCNLADADFLTLKDEGNITSGTHTNAISRLVRFSGKCAYILLVVVINGPAVSCGCVFRQTYSGGIAESDIYSSVIIGLKEFMLHSCIDIRVGAGS